MEPSADQLAYIISQSMFIGEVYAKQKNKPDFDEKVFRDYARAMINISLKTTCLEDERIAEISVSDFLSRLNF
jgi:hypothetical protein